LTPLQCTTLDSTKLAVLEVSIHPAEHYGLSALCYVSHVGCLSKPTVVRVVV
jgi:hypothetical protein